MWGYERGGDSQLVPSKTQEEHFELFCMVLERGFAIHTCHSDRLLVEFRLSDAGSGRYLPRIHPKRGVSFRIPEAWLQPSDLFLHYDPASEADIPTLAYFCPDTNRFLPYDDAGEGKLEPNEADVVLPLVKLSTLKGLHYIKDIACLQLFTLDFVRLRKEDPVLAQQVHDVLWRKLERYIEFSHPWVQASHSERVAQQYLDTHAAKPGGRRKSPSVDPDSPFMNWDS